jgi:site-specific recombinase XerD
MAAPKGIKAVGWLARRTKEQRGGNAPQPDGFDRSAPDGLALWRDAYLESLRVRNYSPETIEGRVFALKFFLAWSAERDLKLASQITRPILEAYQRSLSRYTRPNGRPLSWTTQRGKLGTLKDFFRWLTKQNVLLHNPASELEMPRMEKRLPQEVLSLVEVDKLLALPNVLDPLGVRDRAMLEVFYSTGMRRTELCRLELPDFNADRRTLHIRQGKGKKDRMVPVGERAVAWIERYLRESRPRVCAWTRARRPCSSPATGCVQSGRCLALCHRMDAKGGHCQEGQLPFAAAHLRHPHARGRGRYPLHPAVAWAREVGHHGHLYRSEHQAAAGSSCPLSSGGPTAVPQAHSGH